MLDFIKIFGLLGFFFLSLDAGELMAIEYCVTRFVRSKNPIVILYH